MSVVEIPLPPALIKRPPPALTVAPLSVPPENTPSWPSKPIREALGSTPSRDLQGACAGRKTEASADDRRAAGEARRDNQQASARARIADRSAAE